MILVEVAQTDWLRYRNRHGSPFYHTTDKEKRRMFPIDYKLADARTVTSSGTSVGRADFRDDLEGRDGSPA